MAQRRPEEREAADERILGGGDCVERVLREQAVGAKTRRRSLDEVLAEVCERHAISGARLLGLSRGRHLAKVRQELFLRAHEEAGAGLS